MKHTSISFFICLALHTFCAAHPAAELYHTAHALQEQGEYAQALSTYKQALLIRPDHALSHFGRACCYLAQGKFKEGFPELAWRGPQIRQFTQYDWENADLTSKTVLIRAEWGLGDMIQFVRYAQHIKQRGGRVIMQTYHALIPLFSRCPFLDTVVPVGHALPPADIHIPLLSLPQTFNTQLTTIPHKAPYLYARTDLVEQWAPHFADTSYKIGICWQGKGNKHAPPHLNKNIPLTAFAPLAQLPNVRLYSLQQKTGLEELDIITFDVQTFDSSFDVDNGSFEDTAAVMHHLDLIITIDTSIAHLAGALGRPVWVMLPYNADWRWMTQRSDSPWYPTMHLYRQQTPGNWQQVMQHIQKNLKQYKKDNLFFY